MAYSRRRILELGVVDFGVETAQLPNGLTVELAVVRHPGAAAIVALDEFRRIAMLSQWRHAVGGYLWEIPAGCRRSGENGLQCAQRELQEETGLIASQWMRLGTIVTVPSFSDERIEIFLARDLRQEAVKPDADEVFRMAWIDFAQALKMIASGEIIDAKSIVGIHHLLDHIAD
jgi:8-oxo-dGTP pyrophosphatase MutT (NUDIX family)